MRPIVLPPGGVTRRPGRALAGVLAVIALGALTAASCSDKTMEISLGSAQRADVTEIVDASAAVTARAVATLAAPADGTIVSVSVQPGQQVQAGQILAVIDSPAARSRLDQAAQALGSVRAGGGYGGADLSGAQRRTDAAAAAAFAQARQAAAALTDPALQAALVAQIDAAERSYQEAAASSRALIGSVQRGLASVGQAVTALSAAQRSQAQAAYDLAKSTVDALTLRAPVAGVVQLGGAGSASSGGSLGDLLGAVGAGASGAGGLTGATGSGTAAASGPGVDPAPVLGAQISAGTPVVTVVDTSRLGLLAEVDETDVLLVTPGVTGSVELDAAPGARYDATVTAVDVLPTASGRGGVSYRVRLSLGAGGYGDGRAAPVPRPGMSAIAHLQVRSARDALAVPAAAVFSADGKDAVWVVRAGKAVRTMVTLGVAGPDLVQVVSGLSTGDRVVVRGTDRVRAGQHLP